MMKKTILFLTLTASVAMFSCMDSGKSDGYGNSEDNSGNVYNTNHPLPNGDTNRRLPGNAVKVNYTTNTQTNPDTSSTNDGMNRNSIENK